ncbi:MAG TPA: TonB-dependent receptor [Bryobacteraceae bacterium]|nr:TonB-dependent receptor [Bryobacteraceae bacterium]
MRSLITTFCLLSITSALFAQSDRGTITGTVTDTTGAIVANAQVSAKQLETGSLFPTATTGTGNYTLTQLPVGGYEITISAPGFKTFVRSGVTVQVAQTLRVDATLQIGAASESVTVSAEASLLKTESGDVSSNVNVSTLDTLPILSTGSAASGSSGIRNPNNVLNVVPGVYYVPNSQVKINGAQTNSYAYHVDGMDSTNVGFPYAAAQTQPSVDAIQEVSVQTSNFAPEYGAVGGGFFNVTMKSGGNQYHGTAYDYIVNEVLNAGEPFSFSNPSTNHPDQLFRPPARRHDYGFTIGGPASIPKLYNGKDKTFFFFNFEQFRETQSVGFTETVPTDAYRTGNFSGAIAAANNTQLKNSDGSPLTINGAPAFAGEIFDPLTNQQFPNNTIPPSRLDPVALKVQSLIPAPTTGGTINNFNTTQPSVRHTTIPAVKIDQLIGSKQKISFYWSFTHTDSQYSQIYGNYEGFPTPVTQARGTFIHSHVERLNDDFTLSPTMLLHLGVGYQQNNFFDDAPVLDFNPLTELGLKGATLNRNFPVFSGLCTPANVGGPVTCAATGGSHDLGPPGQTHSYWEKPAANASLTVVRGSHTLKAGTDLYWSAVPQTPYSNTAGTYGFSANETAYGPTVGTPYSGGSLGLPYASFLLGAVDQYTISQVPDFRQSKEQLGFFVQDSWKINRKLTVDYGVRYDFGTYYREEHGRAVNFFPTAPNPNAAGQPGAFLYEGHGPGACNCNFANNYPFALGPRLGVAYSINDKTVFRAGWGLIYGQTSTNPLGINSAGIVNTLTQGSPGQGQPATILQNGIPVVPAFPSRQVPLNASGNQPLPTGVVFLDPQAGRPPRQNQWSIGIERELKKDLALDVSYVANRGVWWQAPSLVDINAVTPQILAAHGFNLNDPATTSLLFAPAGTGLLSTPLAAVSPAVAAQYNLHAPYAGFSTSQTVAQSLRPYPQFANIPVSGDPLGKTWYDSLQAKLTQRFSHGLTLTSTFTWQKSLQVGTDGNTGTTVTNGGATPTNYVNNTVAAPFASKSISSFDQPFVFTVAGSYTLPNFHQLRKASYVFRDWQIGTVLTYSSGLPIPVPASTTSIANQLFQGALDNRVPGVPLYTVSNLNCHCYDPSTTTVLNPAAWQAPTLGQFGNAAPFYSDYRYERHPAENINLGRTWRFRERMSLNLRVEFSNFLNRTFLNNPVATNPTTPTTHNPANPAFLSGGFGYISTVFAPTNQLAQPRNGTIVARFSF